MKTTLISVACGFLLGTGVYFLGYSHGKSKAEETWSEAYRIATDAYIEQAAIDAKASANRLADAMRKRQATKQRIAEAESELKVIPVVGVLSADELRGLESLHRAYFGDAGSVPGGVHDASAADKPGKGLHQATVPVGLRVPEPSQ